MNPYATLLDDPDRLDMHEHIGEVNAGMGLPWQRDPAPMRASSGSTAPRCARQQG